MAHNDRWKDPAAWECLSDEQRDIINEWYESICDDNRAEKNSIRSWSWSSSYIALIPFAAIFGYELNERELDWYFLLSVAVAWFVYAFVFTIFRTVSEEDLTGNHSRFVIVKHIIYVSFASLCMIGLIFR